MLILSLDALELTAKIHLYPLSNETKAKLKPVLPDVVSIIVLPFFKIPLFSAWLSMWRAILSLLEWPGLNPSNFVKYVPLKFFVTSFSLINGVLPISSKIFLLTWLCFQCPHSVLHFVE